MITRPSTVLRKARDIIAEGKWCKGTERMIGPDGDKFCAIGATAEAVGADWSSWGSDSAKADAEVTDLPWLVRQAKLGADEILDDVVHERTNGKFGSIVSYNDHKHRQRRHVLAVFDEAIKVAEQEERDARNRARRIARRQATLAVK